MPEEIDDDWINTPDDPDMWAESCDEPEDRT